MATMTVHLLNGETISVLDQPGGPHEMREDLMKTLARGEVIALNASDNVTLIPSSAVAYVRLH